MTTLTLLLDSLGIVLLHHLWQATLVAAAVAALLRVVPLESAVLRSRIATIGLLLVPTLAVATAFLVEPDRAEPDRAEPDRAGPDATSSTPRERVERRSSWDAYDVAAARDATETTADEPNAQSATTTATRPATSEANAASVVSGDSHAIDHHASDHGFSSDSATAPPSSAAESRSGKATSSPDWLRWLLRAAVVVWFGGAAWHLSRLLNAHRVARACIRNAVSPPAAVSRRLVELAKRLRIRRAVRLKIAAAGPWMFGWLRPVLVLPDWLVDPATDAELLDAVLLHELTHVRRGDWLLTLVQRLVVAVFFFHPAVRWLSGRVEVEREAAVDATAARLLGDREEDRLVIARSLLEAARRRITTAEPVAATASLAADGGGTEERLARLLHSAKRSIPRGTPWTAAVSLAGFLVVIAGVIVSSGGGTALAEIAIADAGVTADEVATEVGEEEAASREDEPVDEYDLITEGPLMVRANFVMPNGEPAPGAILSYSRVGLGASAQIKPDSDIVYIDQEFRGTTAWITPRNVPGCSYRPISTTKIEEFEEPRSITWWRDREHEVRGVVDFGTVRLEPRVPITFRFTARRASLPEADPLPVEGVRIGAVVVNADKSGSYLTDDELGGLSNSDGEIAIPIGDEVPITVKVRHPGYEEVEWTGETTADEPIAIDLRPAKPITGYVFGPDDRPVADASVVMMHREAKHDYQTALSRHANDPRNYGSTRDVLATTDADGRFTLDSLHGQYRYGAMILKDGLRPTRVSDITTNEFGRGDTLARIDMAAPLRVPGQFTGDLSLLPSYRGERYMQWRETIHIGDTNYGGLFRVPVDDNGRFEITEALGPDIAIMVPDGGRGRSLRLQLTQPLPPLVIDLKERPGQTPPSKPVPSLTEPIRVFGSLVDENGKSLDASRLPKRIAVVATSPDVPLDSRGRRLEPFPVTPLIAPLMQTQYLSAKVDEFGQWSVEVPQRFSDLTIVGGAEGTNITAVRVPLGERFAATQEVVKGVWVGEVRLPPATPGRVRVVDDETGDPISGVRLGLTPAHGPRLVVDRQEFGLPKPSVSDWPGITTDAQGVATVPFVASANQEFTTWVRHPGYEEIPQHRFRFPTGDGAPTSQWRLTPASPVIGRVLDDEGQPLSGIAIMAAKRTLRERDGRMMSWGSNWRGPLAEPLALTGADGRYELTSLIADASYKLLAVDLSEENPRQPAPIAIPADRTGAYDAGTVRMTDGIVVSGRLTGPLDWLPQRDGKPELHVRLDGEHDWSNHVPVAADGAFRIERLVPGTLSLRVPGNVRTTEITSQNITGIELEIKARAYSDLSEVKARPLVETPVKLTIGVDGDGAMTLDGKPATTVDLRAALEQAARRSSSPLVIIEADRAVTYQRVADIIKFAELASGNWVQFRVSPPLND